MDHLFTGGSAMTDTDFHELEHAYLRALENRSLAGLNVLGFGETGVAMSWPAQNPTLVVKRVTSEAARTDAELIKAGIEGYIEDLSSHVSVAPTELHLVPNRHDRTTVYVTQPLFPASTLVENILPTTEPSSDHPILTRLTDVVLSSTEEGRASIDAQFTNFAWVDEDLMLFDIGTPMVFDRHGDFDFPTRFLTRVLPRPTRPLAAPKLARIFEEMGSRRGCFQQAGLSLVRTGQQRWIDPALELFNPHLDEPLTAQELTAHAETMHRRSRGIKRVMMLERWWSTRRERHSFDVFITDSFTNEIL